MMSLAVAGLLAASLPAPADTVKLNGRPPFRKVTVTDFRDGRLVFRGISRQLLRKPLKVVLWVQIDGQPALNRAEQAAAGGDWHVANAAYQEALDAAAAGWLRDLISVRLSRVSERGGRFDGAVRLYLKTLAEQPTLAAQCRPRSPGAPGSPANRQARQALMAFLGDSPPPAAVSAARTLLLELLLYDGVEPLPEELRPLESSENATTRPAPAADRTPLGILPDDDPAPATTRRAQLPPTLAADSLVLAAARAALHDGNPGRAERLVDRGLPYVKPGERGPWRIVLGRCRIADGQLVLAADDLLALSADAREQATAPLALYYAGLAHERMGRTDVAQSLYAELLERDNLANEVQTLARAGLARIATDAAGGTPPDGEDPLREE